MKGNKIVQAIVVACLFACLPFSSFSQKTKSQLEKEKKETLRKIAEAERILAETSNEKEVTMGQLQALNQQIRTRQTLIASIEYEIRLLNGEINDLDVVVSSLKSDLEYLKDEYAEMIYSSYKANKGNSKLMFLFAAENFNRLLKRLNYLKQYSKARKIQAEQIEAVKKELDRQKSKVVQKRVEQQTLLDQQVRESKKLAHSKLRQSNLVAQLTKKERQLKKEVNRRKTAIKKLNELIASIVESEVEKSRTVSTAEAAGEAEISRLFESKKNKLTWPVNSGFVSSKFGKHRHPVLKRIIVINDGIGIQTERNTKVKAVFEGVVTGISSISGMNHVIIIKHGTYYTVYARLRNIHVKKGQRVRASEIIGEVYTNKEGISELEFQVWKERTKLDPEKWLTFK